MRFFYNAFLCFIFSTVALAQISDERFQFKGKFDFDNPAEKILHYELFEGGEKLRLFGERSIQIWDVKNKKVLESRPHGIENLWAAPLSDLSPDKSKFVALEFRVKPEKNSPVVEVPAKIYDARTGKLLAVLDKTDKPVRAALWSENGKTLVTSSDEDFARQFGYRYHEGEQLIGNQVGEIEISFYDGETLEPRATVKVNNLTWRYLTPDGEKLLTTSGPKRDVLGIPYASEKASTIDVWNTHTGRLEKQLPIGDETFFTRTRKLMVSPDGRTLALVLKSRKSDADDRMLVWDIYAADTAPKYTLKANPKIDDSALGYSPDGKLVALDSGKNAQFYEISTGAKKFEVLNMDVPDYWLADNHVGLFDKFEKIRGVEIPSGKILYEKEVFYRTEERGKGTYTTDSEGNTKEDTETVVVDYTRIVPHPNNKFFITYSNQSVRVYDALTGNNLRSLVIPPPVIEKKKKIIGIIKIKFKDYGENLVSRAEWSPDGRMILILDDKKKSLSIWEMKE